MFTHGTAVLYFSAVCRGRNIWDRTLAHCQRQHQLETYPVSAVVRTDRAAHLGHVGTRDEEPLAAMTFGRRIRLIGDTVFENLFQHLVWNACAEVVNGNT